MIFSSRDEIYKMPFGAGQVGKPITFCLYPHKNLFVSQAYLAVEKDGGDREYFTFRRKGELEQQDIFELQYIPKEAGLYWYHMEMNTHFGPRCVERGEDGAGVLTKQLSNPFQLTVTQPEVHTPDWFGKGITYQIFPDRFARSKKPQKTGWRSERVIHDKWTDAPVYLPDANGEIRNNDFFGGDFRGIEEKLPHLASLHVKTIYLNPIFESASNHRYDTGDYKAPDPMLGTEEEFASMCRKAKKLGIRIILDGVFSHTGFDSRYFGGKTDYDDVGAYQSQSSPYYPWYDFQQWPDRYSSWWGIYTLPQVKELEPSYMDYILNNEDSVVRHWMRLGVSGWRLDVADELPDGFIRRLREVVKEENPEGLVLGEVWEDASNKISYDVRRQYLQGEELDSVMNYPLRDSLLAFLGGGPAEHFRSTMETLMENYPHDVFHSLMNSLGTHDTPRILTMLGASPVDFQKNRIQKSQFRLSPEAYRQAVEKLKLAVLVQFSMPGSPCIYYGDEAGMEGFADPFNRGTYPWGKENREVLDFYQKVCQVYDRTPALQEGEFRFVEAQDGLLILERRTETSAVRILINRSDCPAGVHLPCTGGQGKITGLDGSGSRLIVPPMTGEWIVYENLEG